MANKVFAKMLVEKLDGKNIPKSKTDDKQLRQAEIGPVDNLPSLSVLEIIIDGNRSRYSVDGITLSFLQLNP